MIAMPSSSTAMMNVSRNWPSGIIGRMSTAPCRRRRAAPRSLERPGTPAGAAVAGPASGGRAARRHPPTRIDAASQHARQRRSVAARRADRSGRELQLRHAALRRARPSSARRTTSCTSDCSRNRTSAFVGCTLTSTRVGRHLDEQVHLRAALLDRRRAVGVDDRVRDRPVLDDPAVDEDVLRAARRPLLGQRGDVADRRAGRRPPCATSIRSSRSPYS